jgi:hypothetical protein
VDPFVISKSFSRVNMGGACNPLVSVLGIERLTRRWYKRVIVRIVVDVYSGRVLLWHPGKISIADRTRPPGVASRQYRTSCVPSIVVL